MKIPRLYPIGYMLLAVFLLVGGRDVPAVRAQQTAVPAPPATEYTNFAISTSDLRREIDKSQLIVLGQIVKYIANKDVEDTVVVVAETYKGSAQPGERIRVSCVCHHEAAPDPASRVGHRVILFLNGKATAEPWSPASGDYMFFFHPELRTRILRVLGADARKQTRP